jgi:hypothetical protein
VRCGHKAFSAGLPRYADRRMRWIPVRGMIAVLALFVSATGCGASSTPTTGTPAGSAAPTGALTLSGAMTATMTAGSQHTGWGCRVINLPPVPPATTPVDTSLTGEVDFDSSSGAIVLAFSGAATTLTLPLPGELTVPGPPGSVAVSANGADWSAGQSSPTSSGTLTLSLTRGGTIHGSVDANLAPLRGSSAQLHVAGSWNC